MLIKDIWKEIKRYHHELEVKRLEPTSVVSDIFPGQFNYCLDEIHLLRKYGNFIDITEEEHFQKMMPVIRWNDFMSLYHERIKPAEHMKSDSQKAHHLGVFTMSTIGGGHIINTERNNEYLKKSIYTICDFLINRLGLAKKRFMITYLEGGSTARKLEASIKDPGVPLRVEAEKVIERDEFSRQFFLEWGFEQKQLVPNNTRDNFLTSNWEVFTAPWGYRNEIFYMLPNGEWLDIATIENLIYKPLIEERGGTKFVIDIQSWEKCFVINGLGIERVSLATSGRESIFDLQEFKEFRKINVGWYQIEVLRILHRILTDSRYENITGRSRREKVNMLMKEIRTLPLSTIISVLMTNSAVYASLFPELQKSIPYVITTIGEYSMLADK